MDRYVILDADLHLAVVETFERRYLFAYRY